MRTVSKTLVICRGLHYPVRWGFDIAVIRIPLSSMVGTFHYTSLFRDDARGVMPTLCVQVEQQKHEKLRSCAKGAWLTCALSSRKSRKGYDCWCMKIGTNRNLEDPTGFGTSPGFCSTTQRIYAIFFNFCPNKAMFLRLPVSEFLLLAFAASPIRGAKIFTSFSAIALKSPGALNPLGWKGFVMMPKELGKYEKMSNFSSPAWSSWIWTSHLSDKVCANKCAKKWNWSCFGRCTKFPEHHTAGALVHRSVHATFPLAPKIVPSSWVLLWMQSEWEQPVEKASSSQEQMLTLRLGSPLIAMLHMLTSWGWRVINFPLSQKSHGSTCFPPDLPGSSFQTPAILSVGGGGQWSPGPCLQRNRLPGAPGCGQQRRLDKDGGHSSCADVAELLKSSPRGRLAPFPKAIYNSCFFECPNGSCRVSSMANALGNIQCRGMAAFRKASYISSLVAQKTCSHVSGMADAFANAQCRGTAAFRKAGYRWIVRGQTGSSHLSSMANVLGNTQCRSMAAFRKASERWLWSCRKGSYPVSSMADAVGNTQCRSMAAFRKAS